MKFLIHLGEWFVNKHLFMYLNLKSYLITNRSSKWIQTFRAYKTKHLEIIAIFSKISE